MPEYDSHEMKLGQRIEAEHRTTVQKIIEDSKAGHAKPFKEYFKDIAEDHLAEIHDYYTRLTKMEAEAKKGEGDMAKKKDKKSKKGWIKDAIGKPGALHKQMGVPEGEPIPEAKLEAAAKKGGKLGKRARLAETLKHMKH